MISKDLDYPHLNDINVNQLIAKMNTMYTISQVKVIP